MGNTIPKEPVPATVFIQEIRDAYVKNGSQPVLIVDSPVARSFILQNRQFDGNGQAYLPNFSTIQHATREFPPHTLRINNEGLTFFFIHNLPSQRPPAQTDSSCSRKGTPLLESQEVQSTSS